MILVSYVAYDYINFHQDKLYIPSRDEISTFTKADESKLWIDKGDGYEIFDIRGVNLGLGKPGKYATEFSITKQEYLKWFREIQDLGANVVRTYILAHQNFYDAFYEYNIDNPDPLYLIHGVWVDDYMLHSYRGAFEKDFYDEFVKSCKATVDAIHGKHKSSNIKNMGTQNYLKDISPWVYGYIIGVEWETDIVAFTDQTGNQKPQFNGEYLYTKDASNFEIFLAMAGDELIKYETKKYSAQRSLAFSNWPTTCPIELSKNVNQEFGKYASVDVENIYETNKFTAGQYASYHVYPYYPEYLFYEDPNTQNAYLEYLNKVTQHHSMPVVISEFGVPSSRAMASYEAGSQGRNQGFMSEKQQGEAIISMYQDIINSGCAGGIVFTWQDEWFKRTWNTMGNVDLQRTPYWSDYQTNEQYFGLLSFDPGEVQSICYVDGDKSDWYEDEALLEEDGYKLSMKYDEKFMYFLAEKENFNIDEDVLYIPIDITPKSGSKEASNLNITMSHDSDFVIEIRGKDNSRIWVQERYDTTNALYGNVIQKRYNQFENSPPKNSAKFKERLLPIQSSYYYDKEEEITFEEFDFYNANHYSLLKTYETGKLIYGNANPSSKDFNSLADFYVGDGFVEIKLPWELLNFADPTQMKIHDDYYENYGVEYLKIKSMNAGIGSGKTEINMQNFALNGWGINPKYHERLKDSYYMLQEYWVNN